MKNLSNDWFLEGRLDFEYKKYVLLAYLNQVSREFAEFKLYPAFSDLVSHYQNLHQFQEGRNKLRGQFPNRLNKEEFRKMKLHFEPKIQENPDLLEIGSIVEYALPEIKSSLRSGKEIYEKIEADVRIEPIGITPLYRQEGYLLLQFEAYKAVKAFAYRISFFENVEENYYGISFREVESFTLSLANNYEQMKRSLIKSHTELPNPATYLALSRQLYPEVPSILPVVKRKMLRMLK
ncbi:MAG: hypothetical protein AAFN10_27560 [Bacteroidota bacterium]